MKDAIGLNHSTFLNFTFKKKAADEKIQIAN